MMRLYCKSVIQYKLQSPVLYILLTLFSLSSFAQKTDETRDDEIAINSSTTTQLFERITNVIPDEFKEHPEYGSRLEDVPGSIELIHKRDRFTKVFSRGDQKFTTLRSYLPIHYKDENGYWVTIDTTAILNQQNSTLGIENSDLPISWNWKQDEVRLRLKGLQEIVYSNNDLVYGLHGSSNEDTISPEQGLTLTPSEKSNLSQINFQKTRSYDARVENYWNGIDKTFRFTPFGVKTSYIIKERLPEFETSEYFMVKEKVNIPEGWDIILVDQSIPQRTFENTNDGDLVYVDENSDKVGVRRAATYYHGSRSNFNLFVAEYRIEKTNDGEFTLSYSIPTEFLMNDSTVYPVTIDPYDENSSGADTPTNYQSESSGCQRTMNVNVGGTTVNVTSTRGVWDIIAQNGAWMSEQRSRFYGPANNSTHNNNNNLGLPNLGGTATYDYTGNYANGLRSGNIGFTLRGWRTWGNYYTYTYGCGCGWWCPWSWCCTCTAGANDNCGTRFQYIGYWYVRVNWEYPCTSPTAPTSITSSAGNTICSGNSTTLSFSGGSNGSGATYQWFSGSCGSTVLGTGATLNVSPTSTTTYYVRRVGTVTGCTGATTCASRTITVQTNPTAPTAINGEANGGRTSICEGANITLTASGGSNGSGATYQWYANGCGSGSVLGTGNSITVTPAATGTTYYVRRVGNTNCTATTGCISHTVYTRPNPLPNPTNGGVTSSAGTTICQGTSTTLTVTDGYSAFYQFNGNYNDAGPDNLNLGGGGGSIIGNAYQVNGGGLRQSPATNILNTDYYTLDFDMMITGTGGSWQKFFAYRGANGSWDDRSPGLWRYPSAARIHWRHSPGNSGINEAYSYTVNQWYHITMEKEGTTCRLFIDGNLFATGTVPLKGDASGPLQFGAGSQVRIDNFKIYSGVIRWYAGGSCSGAVAGYGPQFDVTPATTTTYSARVIGECDNSSCVSRTITVNTAPVADAGPNRDNCNNSAYTLPAGASVTGSYSSYAWTYSVNSGSVSSVTGTGTLTPTITPSSATGSVTLTLTAIGIAPCPDATDQMTFTWASGPTANAGSDIGQCGNSDMNFSGASASTPSTFTWTILGGGSGSGTIVGSGTTPSNYSFHPTSASGQKTVRLSVTGSGVCGSTTVTDDVVVTWDEIPTVSTTSPQESCSGQSNISVSPAVVSGAYSSISWSALSGNGTGSIISGGSTTSPTFDPTTDAGDYFLTITLTGSGECTGTDPTSTMSLVWETPPTAVAGGNLSVCENGSIALTGSSINTGGPVDSFTWTQVGGTATGSFTTTNATDPTLWEWTPTSTGTATLQLQVTGSGPCSSTTVTSNRTVTVESLPVANAGSDIVSCDGDNSILMTGATGTGISSYTWSESGGFGTWSQGASVPAASFDPTAGSGTTTAILTVQGTGACSAETDTDTRTLTWHTPPSFTSVTSADITDCVVDNGSIFILANGDGPLEYSINNGSSFQSSASFSSLSAGNYNIVVRDANNCTSTYSGNPVVINDVPPIVANVGVHLDAPCAGIAGGVISVSGITGGDPVFRYGLDGTSSTRFDTILGDPFLIQNLSAGSYDVIIEDQFGCQSIEYPITISEPAPIIIGSPTIVDITGCGGSGTGSISVSASGGTGTLSYSLNGIENTPATSGSWTNLIGGSYEITVEDDSSCSSVAQAQINAPWTLSAGNDATICSGSSIQLEGNIIGEYPNTCLVTCSSGCGMPGGYCGANSTNTSDEWISQVTFSGINNPSGSTTYSNFMAQTATVTQGSNYNIQVQVSKCCGNPGWTECVTVFIDWDRNGAFGAGENYNIGCNSANNPAVFNYGITVPAGAALGNTRMRVYHRYAGYPGPCDVWTYGEVEDYTVNVQGVGACTPTLTWAHGGSGFTSTVSPTTTTTYTLTMDDGDGCVQSASVDVNVSDMDATETVTQVTCNAADDGCVEINATDEVGPYLMKLGSDIKVFGGRMKPITITNSNGALTNHPVKISNVAYTAPMRADFGDVRFYDSNLIELSYWIESYTNSSTMDVWVKIPSLTNGNSTIYMIFGNSSLSSESDGDLVFEFFDDFDFFDSGKWTQGTISSTSGTDWSYYGGQLSGGNTNRIQTSVATFTGSRISESRTFESSSAVNGFTTAGFWASTGNALNILNHNGTNFARSNGGWSNFGSWGAGQRNVWMREYVRAHSSNSIVSRTREIGGTISVANQGNRSLANERIRLGARGDNGAYNQNFSAQWDWMFVRPWVNTEPTASVGAIVLPDNEFCDLAPGTYSIQVVDMGNCSETISVTITEPTILTIDGIDVTNTWCYDNTQGELDITVSGGTPTYNYNWSGPSSFSSTAEDLTGLGAGIYNVTVADDNACTTSSSATVGTNSPLNPPSFTWTGNTDQLWQDPTNWDCGLPDATSEVIIPAVPIGGNTPTIQNGIIGDVLNIDIQGSTSGLLEIEDGGLLRIFEP